MSKKSLKHARKRGRKLSKSARQQVGSKFGRKDRSLVGRVKRAL
jgi:hypothetical protein